MAWGKKSSLGEIFRNYGKFCTSGKILTTNDRLSKHVLAIDPLPPPPHTQALKIKLLKRTFKLLHGYVILIQ
jgi:hypothetical protein